ncbi:MAG: calcium/sodium antiporter [Prevotella sp.]|nr:calcium/sodium antiporter [Bacteroidales bacterium]MCI6102670.1 calcium/sodium antiporter [Bacteroidales bacterium]MDY4955926.1 calcium/sodium antiporter [Prevotella sp.]
MTHLLLFSLASSSLILQIVLIAASIFVVIKGADALTSGGVSLARRMNIPQIVIGLTIVAMGTSMPEFCVSFVSAIKGTPDLAVGNIVGSNIFNSLFIVGCAALVAPMTILHSTVRRDIPFALVSSVMLLMMCLDSTISRLDAAILFLFFVVFMVITVRGARQGGDAEEAQQAEEKPKSPAWAAAMIVVGLALLIGGSNVFVDNASALASSLGVSDAVIGLTIVACGTSLPELATSVVSARRGQSGIAIGNVLGSNVFNILMILGITGIIQPMQISGITSVDLSMLVASMILLWLFSYTKYTLSRWEGAVLVAVFLGYISWLVANA